MLQYIGFTTLGFILIIGASYKAIKMTYEGYFDTGVFAVYVGAFLLGAAFIYYFNYQTIERYLKHLF